MEAMRRAVKAGSDRIVALVFGSGSELQHIDQAGQATSSAFEEVTGQDFLGSGAVLDVDSQTLA